MSMIFESLGVDPGIIIIVLLLLVIILIVQAISGNIKCL